MSFVTSAFNAPVYNLPIFLFGVLAQESSEAIQSLQAVCVPIVIHQLCACSPRVYVHSAVHLPSRGFNALRYHLDVKQFPALVRKACYGTAPDPQGAYPLRFQVMLEPNETCVLGMV